MQMPAIEFCGDDAGIIHVPTLRVIWHQRRRKIGLLNRCSLQNAEQHMKLPTAQRSTMMLVDGLCLQRLCAASPCERLFGPFVWGYISLANIAKLVKADISRLKYYNIIIIS